jgi:hypothetical protein
VPLPEPMLAKLRRLWLTHRNPRWLTPDRSGAGPVSKNALWRTFRLATRAADIKALGNLPEPELERAFAATHRRERRARPRHTRCRGADEGRQAAVDPGFSSDWSSPRRAHARATR